MKSDEKSTATRPNSQDVVTPGLTPPTHPLPTRRIAFDKQLNLLRAYAAAGGGAGGAVTNAEAAKLAGMAGGTVSINKVFFASAGLLTKTEQGYAPSTEVISFHRAWSWSPATAGRKLAPAIRDKWFAKAIVPKLTMDPMGVATAVEYLAEACAAGPEYSSRLLLLLDYLETAGLIAQENGKISLGVEAAVQHGLARPTETEAEDRAEPTPKPSKPAPRDAAIATTFAKPTEGAVHFHVDVRVDMSEMEGWKPDRIAAFFAGIAQVLAAKGQIEKQGAGSGID